MASSHLRRNEAFTDDDIILFHTATKNSVRLIELTHNFNFIHFYMKKMKKIYNISNDDEEFKILYDNSILLHFEVMAFNKLTFIQSFDLYRESIYCMDGAIHYGINDDELAIDYIAVNPDRIRQGIFSNFLLYVAKFDEINSIFIEDISEELRNLLSHLTINSKPFTFEGDNAIWYK